MDGALHDAAGEPDMGAFDVSLLHHVNHRDRKKKLADICFVLNVEDTHVVTYALKKLVKAGYVTSEKRVKSSSPPRRKVKRYA
jgi:predicted MarR family transcription regulator